ncbi:MAG: uroporphyrinogen decarboxylase family protein [Clostridia bacterium]|nr:uroporphyrinogen decarboxylase family protein [Clostridia bacterium]
MDMFKWLEDMKNSKVKKAMPVLSFPSIQLLDITVKQLISDYELQAQGMKAVADKTDSAASVSLMDLSVEAECFGANIIASDDEVPTVTGHVVTTMEDAVNLVVPEVGCKRTKIYIEAIRKAKQLITDRPVLAGVIGPFSLAGRLLDVTEAMVLCYDEPEIVHEVLKKVTSFITEYIKAYREAGADGIVLAEPLAGLLSPSLADEFSSEYVKQIVENTQTEDFIIVYHNCGDNVLYMLDGILDTKSAAYHFGNSIDMEDMMKKIPNDIIAMGNVDPAGQIKNGTVDSIREETLKIMKKCCKYDNFIISTGCDVPPMAPWENINAFFDAVNEYYNKA